MVNNCTAPLGPITKNSGLRLFRRNRLHSAARTNNGNDDKTVDVEILVKSENATRNNVDMEELFEDDKS